jgi:hypothetical protein
LIISCSGPNNGSEISIRDEITEIIQEEDGTISLTVDEAGLYSNEIQPAYNTAEWFVNVRKRGRYEVWLTSATKDTNDLHYDKKVMFNISDKRLEVYPACDRIIRNSKDVSAPYFRADSFLGSMYIQDTGLYNVQVISEKILPKKNVADSLFPAEETLLLSVFLTPEIQ